MKDDIRKLKKIKLYYPFCKKIFSIPPNKQIDLILIYSFFVDKIILPPRDINNCLFIFNNKFIKELIHNDTIITTSSYDFIRDFKDLSEIYNIKIKTNKIVNLSIFRRDSNYQKKIYYETFINKAKILTNKIDLSFIKKDMFHEEVIKNIHKTSFDPAIKLYLQEIAYFAYHYGGKIGNKALIPYPYSNYKFFYSDLYDIFYSPYYIISFYKIANKKLGLSFKDVLYNAPKIVSFKWNYYRIFHERLNEFLEIYNYEEINKYININLSIVNNLDHIIYKIKNLKIYKEWIVLKFANFLISKIFGNYSILLEDLFEKFLFNKTMNLLFSKQNIFSFLDKELFNKVNNE